MATIIDLLPLWLLSLPLCTLAAFALRLDIFWVYLCMMSEHVVKLLWSLHRFRSGLWINNLTGAAGPESSAL
ncbi:hypothetical protein SDC9_199139 [bioreactor metagenome]|uniref:Uncharacterized protein n=1 Tax=bioreactor metagenome TaxID=1076179 RepID=A0A645IJM8_9ZZZZ